MTDTIKTVFTCPHNRDSCPYCAEEYHDKARKILDEFLERLEIAYRSETLFVSDLMLGVYKAMLNEGKI